MSVYMIFYQDEINDRNALQEYSRQAGPTLAGTGVAVRVATESVESIEGDWKPARVVMLEFPDKESALRWYQSPEYSEVRKLRLASTTGAGILVEGLPAPR